MDNLYREQILDHYKNPRNYGKVDNPTATCRLYNSACGDDITVSVKLRKRTMLEDMKFEGHGCAVSTASASLLSEKVKNMSVKEVMNLKKEDVLNLLGTKLTPTRLKCALLPLEAIHKTLVLAKNK